MTSKTLRKVQPAHKSKKVTVGQAKSAWLRTGDKEATRPKTTGSVRSKPSTRGKGNTSSAPCKTS